MKALMLRAALPAALAAILAAACGGDDSGADEEPLTEAEYFQRADALMQETDAVLERELEDGTDGGAEDELRERFARQNEFTAQTFEDLVDDLAELMPPSAFNLLHGEIQDALIDYARNLRAFAGFVRANVGEDSETGEIGETIAAAYDRLVTLCAALEAAGSRYDVEIDLSCSADSPARNGATIDIGPGIRGRLAPMPPLPDGLTAASNYIEFETENGGASAAVIGIPLTEPAGDTSALAWYAYDGGEWMRLEVGLEVLLTPDAVAQGEFASVPPSLAVLREE